MNHKLRMKRTFTFLLVRMSCCGFPSRAQFDPAAGVAGSKAIHKDSNIFKAWASSCKVQRGLMEIDSPSLGYASAGNESAGIGPAGGNGIVSLGDGGAATLGFGGTLFNGPGPDFAVFENGFAVGGDSLFFLELGFVEVSSDSIHFHRFAASSLTDTTQQIW